MNRALLLCLFACGPTSQPDPAQSMPSTGLWEVTTTSTTSTQLTGKGMLVIDGNGKLTGAGATNDTNLSSATLINVNGTVDASGAISGGQWKYGDGASASGAVTGSFSAQTGSGGFTGFDGQWTATKVGDQTGSAATATTFVGTWRNHALNAYPTYSASTIVVKADGTAELVSTFMVPGASGGSCTSTVTMRASYTVTNGKVTVVTEGYTSVASNCVNTADNGTYESSINVGTFTCDVSIATGTTKTFALLRNCSHIPGLESTASFGAEVGFLVKQ